jgi:hypothetical protein
MPDSSQVFTPAGAGPAVVVSDAVRLAVSGGTVHLGRLLAPTGVHYIVVVDGLAPSMVGTVPASVSAPPPAGLDADLLQQDDLQVVPGELGVQVFENSEDMPVTAVRTSAWPLTRTSSYPGVADVVGWQPVLSALSGGAPAAGPVTAGTLYAGYAPAGSFALTIGGRSVSQRPAFGWAAQYTATKGQAALSLSQFPYVPVAVLLELAAWVALAAVLVGRPRRAAVVPPGEP